jgi:hypothetical protein
MTLYCCLKCNNRVKGGALAPSGIISQDQLECSNKVKNDGDARGAYRMYQNFVEYHDVTFCTMCLARVGNAAMVIIEELAKTADLQAQEAQG